MQFLEGFTLVILSTLKQKLMKNLGVSQLVKMSFVEMRRDLQVEGYERV